MDLNATRATVLALIAEIAPEVDLTSVDVDADLRRAVDLDSLDFQNLVESVARATGVEIPEIDYPQIRTLRGLTSYVAAHSR